MFKSKTSDSNTASSPVLVSQTSTPNNNNNDQNQTKKKKGFGFGKLFGRKNSNNNEHASANKQITDKMAQEEAEQKSTLDILLLGAGGSGKTTVFKQMQKLFHGFIDEKEMEFALDDIRQNVIIDVIDLCKYNAKLLTLKSNDNDNKNDDIDEKKDNDIKIKEENVQKLCLKFANLNDITQDIKLTKSLSTEIDILWNDIAMKNTWTARKRSHIMDNTPYFLDKVQEIAKDEYVVSFDDFVRVRDQTTGIIHKKFLVKSDFGKYKFNVTDVGGQRSERRKWMKLFDNVNVVVYIMNLAGYDQVLYEDNSRNCLAETLDLFTKTCHSKAFDKTDWVVFFNKIDIFDEKIKNVPFTVYKSDFDPNHANDGVAVQEYIRQQFRDIFSSDISDDKNNKNKNQNKSRQIYFHTTCATDSNQVGQIIKKVQIDIITSAMKKMGYLY